MDLSTRSRVFLVAVCELNQTHEEHFQVTTDSLRKYAARPAPH